MSRVTAILISCLSLALVPSFATAADDVPPAEPPAAQTPAEDPVAPEPEPEPEPPSPAPVETPDPEPKEATLRVALRGLSGGKLNLGDRAKAVAQLSPKMRGEPIRFTLKRGSRVIARRTIAAGKRGRASWKVRPVRPGAYRIFAQHRRSARISSATDTSESFGIRYSSLGQGNYGRDVALLNRKLRKLGFATGGGRSFSSQTARAVLAYRKANGLPRTQAATRGIVKRLMRGKGRVKLRYPKAGRHVEADLSRQILILANRGKAVEVYHTSSGTSATPTILGHYRFYLRQPGYNSKSMYYSTYFIRGYAIHGYDPVPTYPASHGCLRVPISDAIHIYNWVDIGMSIYVYR